MPLSEIISSLFGLWRILLIDKRSIQFFDNSYSRAIRSFIIPGITYLAILAIIFLRTETYEGNLPLSLVLLAQTLRFIITLCGSLIITYSILKHLEKSKEFMRYVQMSNWLAILAFFLTLPIIFIDPATEPMAQFFFFILLFFQKIYEWFIIQITFQIQWYYILLILVAGEVVHTLVSAMAYVIIY